MLHVSCCTFVLLLEIATKLFSLQKFLANGCLRQDSLAIAKCDGVVHSVVHPAHGVVAVELKVPGCGITNNIAQGLGMQQGACNEVGSFTSPG